MMLAYCGEAHCQHGDKLNQIENFRQEVIYCIFIPSVKFLLQIFHKLSCFWYRKGLIRWYPLPKALFSTFFPEHNVDENLSDFFRLRSDNRNRGGYM